MSKTYDVIVIGAGPAGAATALLLQARGYEVCVVERARFPRDKVCGEFISPAADPILEKLGVLSAIEATNPLRLRGVAISAYEGEELAIDYPPHAGRAMTSLSLSRLSFDHILFSKMQERGITVLQEHQVDDLVFDAGMVTGITGRDPGNQPFTLHARVVVDAGGRNAVSIRRMGLRRRPKLRRGKVALAAHWKNAELPADYCYMHISRPGYTGMAPVGDGTVNVVLVVDADRVKGEDIDDFYRRVVLGNARRREMLKDAEPAERVRTVDSLAFEVDPLPCGGLVLVGDAMGFIDPFTGEGIYLGLRSAELAAATLDVALQKGDVSRWMLERYALRRKQEFHKKFVLSRILQRLIYRPGPCRSVVRLLAEYPSLAATLVGVIGDYLPAGRVVSMSFLLRVVMAWVRTPAATRSLKPSPSSALDNRPLPEEG
ncbi:NAD(P)/FAD-dependent oxidoreductase [Nitrospina gracilis]|uniref:NAD(P)/FAD-dependent oxidoreductase n=1 Tax=Nitrospina gracilis TaxID=35801 RepID=UPI001F1B3CC8|nr:NAD(P)/FAD-dependent oxidoreductase [Nitrospina gracilis]MCF8721033.1 flavin-dependent dehydrogenase [Nitrospina gracilis Nb-211]